MQWKPRTWPTFAAEVLNARESLRLADEIGLAIRAERQRLGMSQRAYAAHRAWTLATVIRLESAAEAMKLGDVDAALAGTPFQLCLCHRPPGHEPGLAARAPLDPSDGARYDPPPTDDPTATTGPRAPATGAPQEATPPQPVHPAFWPRAELIARVRGGRRRFPAHHVTEQVGEGPPWWWYAESSRAGSVAPDWYAPQYTRRRPSAS